MELETKDFINAYIKYREELEKVSIPNPYLDYDKYVITNDGKGKQWAPFYFMAKDFTRELLNSINQFNTYLGRLIAWNQVMKPYSEHEKLYLLLEFVEPIAKSCLNYPYQIRNRFIFASTHLLHQSNSIKRADWKDDLSKDESIKFNILEKVGAGWSTINQFVGALAVLNDEAFKRISEDYRNKEHHALPPGIEMGITTTISRHPLGDRSVRYGLGGQQPLSLDTIIPGLQDQHNKAVEVFYGYWELIEEQLQIWKAQP
ncbi:MAG TPA: hypothetical protein VMX95_00230 [Thermodesulfobacteriota bacterium]|nr:hypothetical protein [Thermodesulfobacteriota bacterium]